MERGRPEKSISLEIVNELLEAGCLGTEIAGHFGVHPETLYDRVAKESGLLYSVYSQIYKQKGEAKLRKAQYDKAIGDSEKGDNTLLIWLGKTRLNQREKDEQVVTAEAQAKFDSYMEQLTKAQDSRKIDDSNSKADVKS